MLINEEVLMFLSNFIQPKKLCNLLYLVFAYRTTSKTAQLAQLSDACLPKPVWNTPFRSGFKDQLVDTQDLIHIW